MTFGKCRIKENEKDNGCFWDTPRGNKNVSFGK